MSIKFIYNDGGRSKSGKKGDAGDCVCRAISIASNRQYDVVYRELSELNKKLTGVKSARNGINTKNQLFKNYMKSIGFNCIPCMEVGSGCRVHLCEDELPSGRIVVSLSRHFAAVIDGVLNDTFDCSRNGSRCVYGYFYYII